MRLTTMSIKNYRQFRKATINFDEELTIFAGANNSGKTSLIELFKRVFQDKNFTPDDISAEYYSQLQANFIETVAEMYSTSPTVTEFREKVKQFNSEYSKRDIAIRVDLEVQYGEDENISLFSDYLMELDLACKSFYFSFKYGIDYAELIKALSLHAESIYHSKREMETADEKKSSGDEYKQLDSEDRDLLLRIYNSVFKNVVHFTDGNYENEGKMSLKDFQGLFKYNYLKATRLLDDEKTDNHYSISKELLNHFEQSDDWEGFRDEIIRHIKSGLDQKELNEKIKSHSLEKAQTALDSIEKHFDYNRGKFSLQTDISDEHLMNFLSSTLQTFFEFEGGTKLKEFSQGLGISNLIYICLKVESFVKQYQTGMVNIFVIEEPEVHMHPQMERVLIQFINEILGNEDNTRVQGIVTSHSSEIVRCADLKNIRVLRISGPLTSSVYDMNQFKQKLDTEEERQFFTFLFSINYSDLVFAKKIIMYEGDTEKLYIEKLLTENEFAAIANQYIAFVQVGGAYAHWYRKLIYFLAIKTLIITDIDYSKNLFSIDEIKVDQGITNSGLVQYYRDDITQQIIEKDIIPYCENNCRELQESCFYQKPHLDKISWIQSNLARRPCSKIKKPDYANLRAKPDVNDIGLWMQNSNESLIKVVSQGESDSYTRTLEEAMLCKLLGITVEDHMTRQWWKEQIEANGLKLDVSRKQRISVRHIVDTNKHKKTDFMYSVILAGLQIPSLPNYIKEGLTWLAE